MADVDSVRLQLEDVEMRQSSTRQTPITSFGHIMRSGIGGTVNTVSNQAASAGYSIPGAAVVGAAITGVGSVRDANLNTTVNPNPSSVVASTGGSGGLGTSSTGGVGTTTVSAGGSSMDAVANQAAGGSSSAQLLMATQQMQEMNQQFNLQYLQLQENMQAENRQFTALSNVMKTKNDTAKNSLSNLK